MKFLHDDFSIGQIVFFRWFLCLIPLGLMLAVQKDGRRHLYTSNHKTYIFCGFTIATMVYCLFKAFSIGTLANVTSLAYSSIIFLTVLSGIFLKEHVGWRRWLAVIIGFVGILIIANPKTLTIKHSELLALAFALGNATLMMILRVLGRKDSNRTMVLYLVVYGSLFSIPLMIFDGFHIPTTLKPWALIGFLGISGGIGELFLTQAYRYAETVAVGPFTYTSLVWGGLWGAIFLGEKITINLVAGGFILVATGVYLIFREYKMYKSGLGGV